MGTEPQTGLERIVASSFRSMEEAFSIHNKGRLFPAEVLQGTPFGTMHKQGVKFWLKREVLEYLRKSPKGVTEREFLDAVLNAAEQHTEGKVYALPSSHVTPQQPVRSGGALLSLLRSPRDENTQRRQTPPMGTRIGGGRERNGYDVNNQYRYSLIYAMYLVAQTDPELSRLLLTGEGETEDKKRFAGAEPATDERGQIERLMETKLRNAYQLLWDETQRLHDQRSVLMRNRDRSKLYHAVSFSAVAEVMLQIDMPRTRTGFNDKCKEYAPRIAGVMRQITGSANGEKFGTYERAGQIVHLEGYELEHIAALFHARIEQHERQVVSVRSGRTRRMWATAVPSGDTTYLVRPGTEKVALSTASEARAIEKGVDPSVFETTQSFGDLSFGNLSSGDIAANTSVPPADEIKTHVEIPPGLEPEIILPEDLPPMPRRQASASKIPAPISTPTEREVRTLRSPPTQHDVIEEAVYRLAEAEGKHSTGAGAELRRMPELRREIGIVYDRLERVGIVGVATTIAFSTLEQTLDYIARTSVIDAKKKDTRTLDAKEKERIIENAVSRREGVWKSRFGEATPTIAAMVREYGTREYGQSIVGYAALLAPFVAALAAPSDDEYFRVYGLTANAAQKIDAYRNLAQNKSHLLDAKTAERTVREVLDTILTAAISQATSVEGGGDIDATRYTAFLADIFGQITPVVFHERFNVAWDARARALESEIEALTATTRKTARQMGDLLCYEMALPYVQAMRTRYAELMGGQEMKATLKVR